MTDAIPAAPEKNPLRRPAAPHTPIGVVVGQDFRRACRTLPRPTFVGGARGTDRAEKGEPMKSLMPRIFFTGCRGPGYRASLAASLTDLISVSRNLIRCSYGVYKVMSLACCARGEPSA